MHNLQEHVEGRLLFGESGKDIGTLAGLVGGVILGEQVNDYIPQLQQAPWMIHAAVDVAGAYLGSEVTGRVGQKLGELFHRAIELFYGSF